MALKHLRSFVYVVVGFVILMTLITFSYTQLLDLGALLKKLFGD